MLASWLTATLAFLIAAAALPGFNVAGLWPAVLGAFALGLANAIIRPIIILFAFPLTFLTLGLFLFVINGAMLWLVTLFVPGIVVDNFLWAILAAMVISTANAIFGLILG
ncbi:MAG: phage holin family protein [Candidatus Sericytochromatia bacterium]|jgi:putative membrane protein|nr:phage holin family protein [Candidatus Sericytochromatia bacterium]